MTGAAHLASTNHVADRTERVPTYLFGSQAPTASAGNADEWAAARATRFASVIDLEPRGSSLSLGKCPSTRFVTIHRAATSLPRDLIAALVPISMQRRPHQHHQGDGCSDGDEDRDQNLMQYWPGLQYGEAYD